MKETRRVAHLIWEEYASAVYDGILILPVGSTEQHSKHLPLGVDTIIPEKIALILAERVGALVAPVLPYGYKSQPSSGGGPLFPGTIDLNSATMTELCKDLLTEFLVDGWLRRHVWSQIPDAQRRPGHADGPYAAGCGCRVRVLR